MSNKRCLCCYQPLNEGEVDYHPRCAKRFFAQSVAPSLPYTRKDINKLAQVDARGHRSTSPATEWFPEKTPLNGFRSGDGDFRS